LGRTGGRIPAIAPPVVIPKHAIDHQAGGVDQLFNQNLNTTDNVTFARVTVSDLVMKNFWRFTEDIKFGVILKSPEGIKYRLKLERIK